MNMYYNLMFDISLILTLVYVFIWRKHFDVHFTLIFAFIPVVNIGYSILTIAETQSEIYTAIKITYLGGCFLSLFIMMCVLEQCKIRLKKGLKMLLYAISMIIYSTVLTIGKYDIFYRELTFERVDGVLIMHKVYGPMHTVFFIMEMVYFAISTFAIIYAGIKRKDVSGHTVRLVYIPQVICVASFYLGRLITDKVDFTPIGFVTAQVFYLILVERLCLYDIEGISEESIMVSGEKGFIIFDFSLHYLGSNDAAQKAIPELKDVKVDTSIRKAPLIGDYVSDWIKEFRINERNDKFLYRRDGRVYLIDIDYLIAGKIKRGYCFNVIEDTKNQKYIDLINKFNSRLREEVDQKTAHIIEMHDKLILGMATMVESRDNSTGGHIKRTSDCVRILIGEILEDNDLELSDEFCRNIIKAAPMHDLGKISVDDDILRKPGRFEPWEYEKMKAHAPEGARIIHEILKDTDDDEFRRIAENVAKYHHERWDGSGYPEGLKGEDIPIEARIMAIADVYDALVSKRVYKDSMSFEEADRIIMLGMGNQFDKSLEQYYVSARPRLEEYYKNLAVQ